MHMLLAENYHWTSGAGKTEYRHTGVPSICLRDLRRTQNHVRYVGHNDYFVQSTARKLIKKFPYYRSAIVDI